MGALPLQTSKVTHREASPPPKPPVRLTGRGTSPATLMGPCPSPATRRNGLTLQTSPATHKGSSPAEPPLPPRPNLAQSSPGQTEQSHWAGPGLPGTTPVQLRLPLAQPRPASKRRPTQCPRWCSGIGCISNICCYLEALNFQFGDSGRHLSCRFFDSGFRGHHNFRFGQQSYSGNSGATMIRAIRGEC